MHIDFRSLSLFKLIALGLAVLCLIMLFLPWLRLTVSLLDVSESGSAFATGVEGTRSFWSVLLGLFAVLAFVAVALAVFGILTNRSTLVLPLACLAVLMFLFALLQVRHVKGVLKGDMEGYASYFGDFFKVRVGIGGWLFLLFGLGSFGVLGYESRKEGRPIVELSQFGCLSALRLPVSLPLPGKRAEKTEGRAKRSQPAKRAKPAKTEKKEIQQPSPGAWTCPNCGANMSARREKCTLCGEMRPE